MNIHNKTIRCYKEAEEMSLLFLEEKPTIGAFDTETNGLNIGICQPFMFQFGWLSNDSENIHAYVVELDKMFKTDAQKIIQLWHECAKYLTYYFAHNVKFDLHMLRNFGTPYTHDNLSDTQFLIRFAHDNIHTTEGGPPLSLKDYTQKYIDGDARYHEKLIKKERSDIAKHFNQVLKLKLKGEIPPEKFKAKSYTMKVLNEILEDCIADEDSLKEYSIYDKYIEWRDELPEFIKHKVTSSVSSDMIPYNILNRENMIKYAFKDIEYPLKIYKKLIPIIEARDNLNAFTFENKLIRPFYEMEAEGFQADLTYLILARERVKRYIKNKRLRLNRLAGEPIKVTQHKRIKELLKERFELVLESTDVTVLQKCLNENIPPDTKAFISIIVELRTLEKWYSVYITRYIQNLKEAPKLYTQINQVGAVTGRVSSDFQQFPKKPICGDNNVELFHPRKMIKVSEGGYNAIVYLDYSQIELRLQAFYTILVGNTDRNLCRAYMPYGCNNENGVQFDYRNPEHIKNWNTLWYLEEDKEVLWTPLDVHGATTEIATGLTPDHPDFKKLRTEIGKRVNFAKNYGAQFNKIKELFPNKSLEEVRKIDESYYIAFPGIKTYHDYCYKRSYNSSYTENLFGIKYYNVSGHKLINMLIQGSAAHFLKEKIIAVTNYLKEHNLKSKFQMTIHDELILLWHKVDSIQHILKLKNLMEDWTDTQVPIVVDIELSTTTWEAKKEVNSLNEIQKIISTGPIG
jgi:DNA polymerase-1